MKKVIVTGALGFIGFNLCERLLQEGIEVYGIDCMLDDNRKSMQMEKLQYFTRNSQFHFINKSIENINFEEILPGTQVVFHLAAATKTDSKWERLRETIHHNVKCTKKIIQSCTKNTRIVFASTIQVYGERYGVVTESTPTNPITPYGLTKLAGESILLQEQKKRNVPIVILRLPTVYGPWQRPDMTYYQLLMNKDIKQNESIEIDRVVEDIVYVDDVVEALMLAAKTKAENEVFNITSGELDEWYKGRSLITGKDVGNAQNERLRMRISTEKARNVLGFSKKTPLVEGVKKQEEHFKKVINRMNLDKDG
ncbi:NAD-dependent epimerase/dehydratase family protein [Anaerobacillus sp. MEB173]|uniref:NAD-dependent epimerase/dehydratase family protein n=1 Tax=Anaerobacillus sp. MEB173 TaxID=3383345 RepID=UPI003F9361BE